MAKMLFSVAVGIMLIVLVGNLIAWMLPILTSPIVFTVWFGLLLIIVYKLIVRGAK